MILLNTRFFVSDDFDRKTFFKLVCDHLSSQPIFDKNKFDEFCSFDFVQDEYSISSSDDTEKFSISNYDNVFIFSSIENRQDEIISTYYTLDDLSDDKSLQVYQEKLFLKAKLQSDDDTICVKLPDLLCKIFWNEYGGKDDDISTTNEPIVLRKSDIDLAKKIITGNVHTVNPVVYVSSRIDVSGHDIDCERLANSLAGQAHVVVESSPVISEKILQAVKTTDKSKPYNGNIHIYGSATMADHPLEFTDTADSVDQIVSSLRNALNHTVLDDKFNAVKIRQAHTLSKLGADSELSQIFESMLSDKEREIDALRSELSEARRSVLEIKNKADALEGKFEQRDDNSENGHSVSLKVTENELYEGEMSTFILDALKKEFNSIKDDPTLNKSRRYDVLSDILDHNFPCTTGTDLARCLRDASKDGNLTREGIGRLQSSGFTVIKGGDHYKIYLGDETRYFVTLAATPSDKRRGYLNAVSELTNKLFS